MIREDHITVEIAGAGVKPDEIGVSSLSQILSALESGISAVNAALAPDQVAEEGTRPQLEISLVEVKEGNSGDYWARLHHPEQQLPAFVSFSNLLSGDATGKYPLDAIVQAERIAIVCRRKRYTVSVSAQESKRVARAEVTPESKFEIPEPTVTRGKTVVYGEVERVGGREPKVVIRTLDGDKVAAKLKKRSLANVIGERLYDTCGIEGIAEWDASTGEMVAFTVTGINEYDSGSIDSGMRKLRAVVGDSYDGIEDVEAYVREQRNG